MYQTKRAGAALALAGAFVLLYRQVLVKLIHDWATDGNYSHGFFIVPLATYFAWQRRREIAAAPWKPSLLGLFIIVAALAALVAGVLGAELFLTRLSILGVIGGTVLFVCGWSHLRILGFSLAFLLLMIPIPAIIFNQIAFPLQLLASRFGEHLLAAFRVPVLREGNVLILPHASLEVAEACSGIRSLISLLTLAIVYGRFSDRRSSVKVMLALATVPIAIVANGLRVAGTGFAAQLYGAGAAEGFFHTFSGWLVFLAAFGMLVLVQHAIARTASIVWRPVATSGMRWET